MLYKIGAAFHPKENFNSLQAYYYLDLFSKFVPSSIKTESWNYVGNKIKEEFPAFTSRDLDYCFHMGFSIYIWLEYFGNKKNTSNDEKEKYLTNYLLL